MPFSIAGYEAGYVAITPWIQVWSCRKNHSVLRLHAV